MKSLRLHWLGIYATIKEKEPYMQELFSNSTKESFKTLVYESLGVKYKGYPFLSSSFKTNSENC